MDRNDKKGIMQPSGMTGSLEAVPDLKTAVLVAWPEPMLFGESETPDIPVDILPGWVREYAEAVAVTTQTPQGLAVMCALSTLAACTQKRFEVSAYGGDGYTEPLNVWTVTALESGTRKSAVKSAFTDPLTRWEKDEAVRLGPKMAEVRHIREIVLKKISLLKSRAAKLDASDIEFEQILIEILKLEATIPGEIVAPRIWTDDVTPERLQTLLADHSERMALLSDEGGLFEVMAGLYSNGKVNINVFLQGHAGTSVRVERQGRQAILDNPALTMGLVIQPLVLANLGRGAKTIFRENGALARFLYCLPASTVGFRNVAQRSLIPETVRTAYVAGVRRLLGIAVNKDTQGREVARILTLSPVALEQWERFAQTIEDKQGPDGEYSSIRDWTSKLPGAALRIAGLLHVAEHGETSRVISGTTIGAALDLAERLIVHARAAFNLMGDDQSCQDAITVFHWIKRSGRPEFTQKEAMDGNRHFRTLAPLEKALSTLVTRHIISVPVTRQTGGRPSKVYLVNPEVLKTT